MDKVTARDSCHFNVLELFSNHESLV